MPKLVVDLATGGSQDFKLTRDEMTIGRYEYCEIVLESTSVSRHHARIVRHSDGYYLEDLNSINGTYVNRERIDAPQRLNDGDEIHFYKLRAVFYAGTAVTRLQPEPVEPVQAPQTRTLRSMLSADSSVVDTAKDAAKFRAVLRVMQAIGTSLDIDAVLINILDGLFAVFKQARRGNIWLIDSMAQGVVLKASKQVGSQTICSDSFGAISLKVTEEVLASREGLLRVDEVESRFTRSIFEIPQRSLICAPLVGAAQAPIGVVYIDSDERENHFVKDDLEILIAISAVAAQAIEFAWQHESALLQAVDLATEKQRRNAAEQQIKDAESIQQKLYPAHNPEVPGYDIAGQTSPADRMCGDYFDFIPLKDGSLATVVADVCGHGLGPALYMIETRACFHTLAAFETDLTVLLDRANQLLWNSSRGEIFATLFLGRLELNEQVFSYVGAGHEAFVVHADGTFERLEPVSVPLGTMPNATWSPIQRISLNSGDVIFIATDGFQEAGVPQCPMFGSDRVKSLLVEHRDASALEILERLNAAVRSHTSNAPQQDDRTAIVIRVL